MAIEAYGDRAGGFGRLTSYRLRLGLLTPNHLSGSPCGFRGSPLRTNGFSGVYTEGR